MLAASPARGLQWTDPVLLIESMPPAWTAEQIVAWAPDAASAKAGREQAHLRVWSALGCDDEGAWGLCQGSGKNPYQAIVDLGEPAFKCSCPSRKFPCKHGLGLLLLWAGSRPAFTTEAPPWVAEWRASRSKRAEAREVKIAAAVERAADPEAQAAATAQTAKRAAQRDQRVDGAVDDLLTWMGDLLRHGIGDLADKPGAFFADQARRLIDGQAPGLARRVRELGSGLHGEGWQEQVLERLGQLQLQAQAWRRRASLPAALIDDLRQQVGFTVPQEDVLASPPVSGQWTVIGRHLSDEDGVRTARSWLHNGADRTAMILHFAAGSQPLDTSLVAGTRFPGEVCYFPGPASQRAVIRSRGAATLANALPGGRTIASAVSDFGDRCREVPWLERRCLVLAGIVPLMHQDRLWVRDESGDALPVQTGWVHRWRLLAWSTGRPLTICGEFDGRSLLPLSASSADGMVAW